MRTTTAQRANSGRPPAWLPRALLMAVVAVFAAVLAWRALGQLGSVITILVTAWFIALAMEPPVRWLVRHRMRRGVATGLVMFGVILGSLGLLTVFGQLFVAQLVDLIRSVPELYEQLTAFVLNAFGYELPTTDKVLVQLVDSWGTNVAQGVIGVGGTILGGLFVLSAVLLVVFYMVAQGPRFKASICSLLAPERQREVLRVWDASQEQVSNFLSSRILLALVSAFATFVFLTVVRVPYAVPLAAFTGLVSQFVPTIGTYIGGALPVVVGLTVSPLTGLGVVIFIVVYQQVENLVLAPKISAHTMELNPAVAFISVLAFGAVFGALGAFLALPVAATIKAVSGAYLKRHELVDSELLADGATPAPRRQAAAAAPVAADAADTADEDAAEATEPDSVAARS
ncbi:AI-2E family transporter [Cellulomonas cellasea]|uniref:AI-2E family transporter n=1 Tax=Cellulomonas cellasea TaxID=43670 RepID=UPI0025A42E30|nr:AI-2E family transporter [Cellulomonas cellasea]MDM8084198.1 AI-2E family transporter [Cellulomonas cellasea]